MKVYAFEWCSCIYESAFSAVSVHSTLAGAYRAMRTELLSQWARESDRFVHGEKKLDYERYYERFHKPLESERWRVRPIEVLTP